jgi:hypothetical protein
LNETAGGGSKASRADPKIEPNVGPRKDSLPYGVDWAPSLEMIPGPESNKGEMPCCVSEGRAVPAVWLLVVRWRLGEGERVVVDVLFLSFQYLHNLFSGKEDIRI